MHRSAHAPPAGLPAQRERYPDRAAAGRALAEALAPRVGPDALLAGIPRGGAIVASAAAERLHLPVALAFVRKLALPVAPELAVGAIDEDGESVVDQDLLRYLHGDPRQLEAARGRARAEIERQRRCYGAPSLTACAPGAVVVLIDDGLATGATMRAALRLARRHGARRVLVAAPCASDDIILQFHREADEVVCPWIDPAFGAVGEYYRDFDPVSDEAVVAALARAHAPAGGPGEGGP